MEFHVWGKLDAHGKIQSVQSSCAHGDAFNFSPGVGHTPGGEAWLGESGERYVPYATKKELVYKLDTKIDEMSLIMVQLGELTKRLQLQEKLLAEYEEKSERQQVELKKLRAENAELRSMMFKRKRNSSDSRDSIAPCDDSSFTLPKTPISTPMECSDGSLERSPVQENLRFPHDKFDVGNVEDVHGKSESESSSGSANICDTQDKDPSRVLGNALSVDEHGYVPLWGEGELRKQCHEMDHMHLMIDQKGYAKIPDTCYDSADRRPPRDWTDSGLDEMDGFANEATLSVQLTVSERTSYSGARSEEAGPSAGSVASSRDSTITDSEGSKESAVPAKAEVKPTPDAHSGNTLPRYCEIPDDLVTKRSSPVKCQLQGQGQQEHGHGHAHSPDKDRYSGHAHSPDKDRYSNRPPMPLPGQRSSDSHVISSKSESSSVGLPHRNSISKDRNSVSKDTSSVSKEVKKCTDDETREAYVGVNGRGSASRHSSPDLRSLGNDERLSNLIKTMKTTMEWNEARKSLMLKSTSCTREHAEDSLREIVKAAYCKYETRVVGKAKQMPSVESLAQGFRSYLHQKRKYDEELLTKEFLEKCFHLLRTV